MTKTSIYCYEKNGGSCRNKVSLANNFICGAGHSGSRQTSSVSSGLQKVAPVAKLPRISVSQRHDLAIDPSTLPETLTQLAGDRDLDVRHAVAGNTSTLPETLTQLAEDEDRYVRCGVASNISTAPETLAELAKEKDWYIRRAIAGNFSALPETHIFLAQQGHAPLGFARGKSIDELIKDIHLVDQYPGTFGMAYLHRLLEKPLQEDVTHPKEKALIGYVYAKYVESNNTTNGYKQHYKNQIKALFPDDQEMAEMIGY